MNAKSQPEDKGTGYSENPGKVMKDLCGTDTPGFQMDLKADQNPYAT